MSSTAIAILAQAGTNTDTDPLGDYIRLIVLGIVVVAIIAWFCFSLGRYV